uniref:Uncharacterized protein n=1 Tax=Chromera velia CCMP2878 TaxID=1169474 RepID=A0A0G4G1X0_9ALVE|eukprot:Cvel_19766.t1-p1 / transcript=Cvel_19766.t1 / gene=Cvel_19766 / organism=Chromera_velia_CCMP2878 / gene_product=hypothetical protein / transcript_product=hypothetical protein / location=Cvel_scaffold1731:26856-30607(-) / protein_length=1078 / sequence_SO=supercontig / SO=protein_coding / is_pseudo=false
MLADAMVLFLALCFALGPAYAFQLSGPARNFPFHRSLHFSPSSVDGASNRLGVSVMRGAQKERIDLRTDAPVNEAPATPPKISPRMPRRISSSGPGPGPSASSEQQSELTRLPERPEVRRQTTGCFSSLLLGDVLVLYEEEGGEQSETAAGQQGDGPRPQSAWRVVEDVTMRGAFDDGIRHYLVERVPVEGESLPMDGFAPRRAVLRGVVLNTEHQDFENLMEGEGEEGVFNEAARWREEWEAGMEIDNSVVKELDRRLEATAKESVRRSMKRARGLYDDGSIEDLDNPDHSRVPIESRFWPRLALGGSIFNGIVTTPSGAIHKELRFRGIGREHMEGIPAHALASFVNNFSKEILHHPSKLFRLKALHRLTSIARDICRAVSSLLNQGFFPADLRDHTIMLRMRHTNQTWIKDMTDSSRTISERSSRLMQELLQFNLRTKLPPNKDPRDGRLTWEVVLTSFDDTVDAPMPKWTLWPDGADSSLPATSNPSMASPEQAMLHFLHAAVMDPQAPEAVRAQRDRSPFYGDRFWPVKLIRTLFSNRWKADWWPMRIGLDGGPPVIEKAKHEIVDEEELERAAKSRGLEKEQLSKHEKTLRGVTVHLSPRTLVFNLGTLVVQLLGGSGIHDVLSYMLPAEELRRPRKADLGGRGQLRATDVLEGWLGMDTGLMTWESVPVTEGGELPDVLTSEKWKNTLLFPSDSEGIFALDEPLKLRFFDFFHKSLAANPADRYDHPMDMVVALDFLLQMLEARLDLLEPAKELAALAENGRSVVDLRMERMKKKELDAVDKGEKPEKEMKKLRALSKVMEAVQEDSKKYYESVAQEKRGIAKEGLPGVTDPFVRPAKAKKESTEDEQGKEEKEKSMKEAAASSVAAVLDSAGMPAASEDTKKKSESTDSSVVVDTPDDAPRKTLTLKSMRLPTLALNPHATPADLQGFERDQLYKSMKDREKGEGKGEGPATPAAKVRLAEEASRALRQMEGMLQSGVRPSPSQLAAIQQSVLSLPGIGMQLGELAGQSPEGREFVKQLLQGKSATELVKLVTPDKKRQEQIRLENLKEGMEDGSDDMGKGAGGMLGGGA